MSLTSEVIPFFALFIKFEKMSSMSWLSWRSAAFLTFPCRFKPGPSSSSGSHSWSSLMPSTEIFYPRFLLVSFFINSSFSESSRSRESYFPAPLFNVLCLLSLNLARNSASDDSESVKFSLENSSPDFASPLLLAYLFLRYFGTLYGESRSSGSNSRTRNRLLPCLSSI